MKKNVNLTGSFNVEASENGIDLKISINKCNSNTTENTAGNHEKHNDEGKQEFEEIANLAKQFFKEVNLLAHEKLKEVIKNDGKIL